MKKATKFVEWISLKENQCNIEKSTGRDKEKGKQEKS